MIVLPYKRRPAQYKVALLTVDGDLVDEHGKGYRPGELPATHRAWCSWDTAQTLVAQGVGEALCWNGEEIRWRHTRLDKEGWTNRPTDVSVLKLPFPDSPTRCLRGLTGWRDWLAEHGASANSTTGSAAWSLLRATVQGGFKCSSGEPPKLRQTSGGRVEESVHGPGCYKGRLEQWDLPAAYASTLAELRYGGRWLARSELDALGVPAHPLEWWGEHGMMFVRARVRVGQGWSGPLLRRPRAPSSYGQELASRLEHGPSYRYPTSTALTGTWAWPELRDALQHGARILQVKESWLHLGGRPLFEEWWQAVQEGRELKGLAGQLAKMTGNALLGRFAMDLRHAGERTIRSKAKGKTVQSRTVPKRAGPWPAHDLAETVVGSVRGRLYTAMSLAGDRLLSTHTDGIWTHQLDVDEVAVALPGWRLKQHARRLDLLSPQMMRYLTPRGAERVLFAGVPFAQQAERFSEQWQRYQEGKMG